MVGTPRRDTQKRAAALRRARLVSSPPVPPEQELRHVRTEAQSHRLFGARSRWLQGSPRPNVATTRRGRACRGTGRRWPCVLQRGRGAASRVASLAYIPGKGAVAEVDTVAHIRCCSRYVCHCVRASANCFARSTGGQRCPRTRFKLHLPGQVSGSDGLGRQLVCSCRCVCEQWGLNLWRTSSSRTRCARSCHQFATWRTRMIAEERSTCVHHKLLSFCAQCLAHIDGINGRGDYEPRLQFQMFQLCETHSKNRGVGTCLRCSRAGCLLSSLFSIRPAIVCMVSWTSLLVMFTVTETGLWRVCYLWFITRRTGMITDQMQPTHRQKHRSE